jgi:hypothetical protein
MTRIFYGTPTLAAVEVRSEGAFLDVASDNLDCLEATTFWPDGSVTPGRQRLLGPIRRPIVDECLRHLYPGSEGCLELRAYNGTRNDIKRRFIQLPLTEEKLGEVQAFAMQYGLTHNIYMGVATRRDRTSGRLDNCATLNAVFAEIDFKSMGADDASTRLNAFPLQPSLVIHSGGGLHVYWLLEEPIDLSTDDGRDLARHLLAALAHRIGADVASAEPARILRVPDTLNHKPQYGKSGRIVTSIIWDWRRVYALARFCDELGEPIRTSTAGSMGTEPIVHALSETTRVARAKVWAARQPPAVEGQGGDLTTFKTCATVAIGHDLEEDQALEALRDWNLKCRPPWSDHELRTKIRNAILYGSGRRGERLVDFPLTEVGDAEFFADRHGERVRFDHRRGRWLLASESGLWIPDPVEQLRGLMVESMRERQRHASTINDELRKKQAFVWAVNGERTKRLDNALREAPSATPNRRPRRPVGP